MSEPIDASAVSGTRAGPGQGPPSQLGLGLAIGWLVLVSLGCAGSLTTLFEPEVAANVSIVTIPFFVSGWASVAAAIVARRRPAPLPLMAPLVAAGGGLLVGLIGILVLYAIVWPGYL